MSQPTTLTLGRAAASQAPRQSAPGARAGQHAGAAQSASVLAAQWQSALRPATVPLLPPPGLQPEPAAPGAATAAGVGAAPARSATLALPSLSSSAPTAQAQEGLSEQDGLHRVLIAVLSVILVLLVLYLIAGPFGGRVAVLQPLHNVLAGLVQRG